MRYVDHMPGARDAEILAAAFSEPEPLERAVTQSNVGHAV